MSFSQSIVTNAAAVLNFIKQYTSNPKIAGLPIQSYRFECITEAEVSRHVLISLQGPVGSQVPVGGTPLSSQQGLYNVMDNIAPGPRTWEIEGYLVGLPIELTSLYMPSLRLQVDLLVSIFNSRQYTQLVDPSFRSANVLISRLKYSYQADTQNAVPIQMSLVEITVLSVGVGPTPNTPINQNNSSPAAGAAGGLPANGGSTPGITLLAPPTFLSNASLVLQGYGLF